MIEKNAKFFIIFRQPCFKVSCLLFLFFCLMSTFENRCAQNNNLLVLYDVEQSVPTEIMNKIFEYCTDDLETISSVSLMNQASYGRWNEVCNVAKEKVLFPKFSKFFDSFVRIYGVEQFSGKYMNEIRGSEALGICLANQNTRKYFKYVLPYCSTFLPNLKQLCLACRALDTIKPLSQKKLESIAGTFPANRDRLLGYDVFFDLVQFPNASINENICSLGLIDFDLKNLVQSGFLNKFPNVAELYLRLNQEDSSRVNKMSDPDSFIDYLRKTKIKTLHWINAKEHRIFARDSFHYLCKYGCVPDACHSYVYDYMEEIKYLFFKGEEYWYSRKKISKVTIYEGYLIFTLCLKEYEKFYDVFFIYNEQYFNYDHFVRMLKSSDKQVKLILYCSVDILKSNDWDNVFDNVDELMISQEFDEAELPLYRFRHVNFRLTDYFIDTRFKSQLKEQSDTPGNAQIEATRWSGYFTSLLVVGISSTILFLGWVFLHISPSVFEIVKMHCKTK